MPQYAQYPRFNYTQLYLLTADIARCILYLSVHMRFLILLPLTGVRFLPGGIADFYLVVRAICAVVDCFDYVTIFGKIPRESQVVHPQLGNLIFTLLEHLVVSLAILCYPKIAKNNAFTTLVYSESLVEVIRYYYNFYKVRTFDRRHKTLRFCKKLSYTILVPVQVLAEMCLLLDSLQFQSYYEELAEYDFGIKVGIRILLLFYLPAFYTVYKGKLYDYYILAWVTSKEHAKKI
ncbi:hypothetical protein FOA43_000233 [Brettanomyces nanus]|uniref:very-long-chain (3R)-3-hydroxyacyl-CoA dehydratase n=1 Tax=Eeniella nana TaxID=13502 RepID=A0A875RZ33_EENNA|nr:uncharacterized protein FOA43_000233 [Brettanomyces nanus]QPG72929.1 hypothetical protein FOA43_000233 [Brettanomyces nanus]